MRRHGFIAIVVTLAAFGCSDEEPTALDLGGPAANLAIAGGDAQVGYRDGMLPAALRVRVTDGAGRPVPAVAVEWTGSGTFQPAVDSTDDNGFAETRWVLPDTPGTVTATAAVEGLGAVPFTATVQPVAGTITFRYVDAGAYHACGITETEEILCWGINVDGQLGRGTITTAEVPDVIAGGQRYRHSSGGRFHNCAITLSEIGYCWGRNADGRLGQPGGGEIEPEPIQVTIEPPTGGAFVPKFQQISAGRHHSCGTTIGRELICWGSNEEAQLGVSPDDDELTNIAIVRLHDAARVTAAGGLHSCAIAEDQVLLCWGFNADGQVGIGLGSRNVTTPTAVGGALRFRVDADTVPRDPTGAVFGPALAAGFAHTCAIATTGATYCWGINEEGQLGIGNRNLQATPTPVGGGLAFEAISAGLEHTCGLTADGAAYCWGDNSHGQLGIGTRDDALVPTPVSGGLVFQSINAGDTFTCGVTRDGVAYCWGDNEYRQIGDLTTEDRLTPTRVAFQP